MIHSYFYSTETGLKRDVTRAEMHAILKKKQGVLWVDMDEATDLEDELLVEIFNFHELAIEDALNDHCGSKLDDYGDYLFMNMDAVTLKMNESHQRELVSAELSMFLGCNYVVTYHKKTILSILADRLAVEKKPQSQLGEGAGALLHTIIDHLVDSYTSVIHQYEDKVDEIETEIFSDGSDYLKKLMSVKQDIFKLRRVFSPQRDMLYSLARFRKLVGTENEFYFRDVYDHLAHIVLMTEAIYENLTGILQVYFSYSSTKLNEVMKRLTVMATLTMPALLIFSLYGMNFEWMPFLKSPAGFWISQAVTFFMAVGMLAFMKYKRWI
ncbi:MAG TPA: magnesium and cobalt transport protein CorA [Candidatus Omnitrophica bacterium]|nr:magnesium and cobalt transport protein CorA [Candidatus Omnitrophota bacterium]